MLLLLLMMMMMIYLEEVRYLPNIMTAVGLRPRPLDLESSVQVFNEPVHRRCFIFSFITRAGGRLRENRGSVKRLVFERWIERFSHDLEMKTREQNRNNKRTEIERFDWFIERSGEKPHA